MWGRIDAAMCYSMAALLLFQNVPCLSFSPYEGYLVPNGSATISVECGSPGVVGKLKTIVQVLINGKPAQ